MSYSSGRHFLQIPGPTNVPEQILRAMAKPTNPVEIIVPAGPGGAADQMARTIQSIVTKTDVIRLHLVLAGI